MSSLPCGPCEFEVPTNATQIFLHYAEDNQTHLVVTPSNVVSAPTGWSVVPTDHVDVPFLADAVTHTVLQIQVTPTITVTGGTFTYTGTAHPATAVATDLLGNPIAGGTFAFTYDPGGASAPVGVGNYQVSATFTSSDPNYTGATANGAATIVVNPSGTTTTLGTSASVQAAGVVVTLTASVSAAPPGGGVPSGTVTFTEGATILGTAPLDNFGAAVFQTTSLGLGPHTITASYAGNDNDLPSASSAVSVLIYAWAAGGASFVIGNANASVGAAVNFWGSQWSQSNPLSGGSAPSSFKGFALTPTVAGAWSTNTGNSPPPPATVPAYLGVIVTNAAFKSGSTISGTITGAVVVQVNPGYMGDPGHVGTGTVVGIVQ